MSTSSSCFSSSSSSSSLSSCWSLSATPPEISSSTKSSLPLREDLEFDPTTPSQSPSESLATSSSSAPSSSMSTTATIPPTAATRQPSTDIREGQHRLHHQPDTSMDLKPNTTKYHTRRLQVRKAQSHHRQRKKDYIKQLEREISSIRGMIDVARGEVDMLAKENQVMALRMKL